MDTVSVQSPADLVLTPCYGLLWFMQKSQHQQEQQSRHSGNGNSSAAAGGAQHLQSSQRPHFRCTSDKVLCASLFGSLSAAARPQQHSKSQVLCCVNNGSCLPGHHVFVANAAALNC
jgi:hypothetical protein